MGIIVDNISKRFGNFQALDQVSVEVKTGSLVALLGPSGSGKSTLLRMIAGLEVPDQGRIILTGEDATFQDVQDRNIGFVFQHYALFKHLTVRKNIAFGMEIRKVAKNIIKAKVDELLDLVQLKGLGDRYPNQLSGGQRQRVALARALAVEPKVLLLDEPFGALDAKVRKELRAWLRRLHDEVHVTSVFVTHDQEEAMEVSDEIVIMNHGRVEQIGTPQEIYDRPATAFVMSFIGPVNIVAPNGTQDQVFIRPQDILIELTPQPNSLPARINRLIHLGWEIQVELVLGDGQVLMAHLTRDQFDILNLQPQQQVFVESRDTKSFPLSYSI
ncbi:sulfate ABC transporter, ATP-binding protein [Synechococcus sp. PCC 7502]|uniref:sulfate/molybdate ABC transporter ATP-binding protein n=1 Tax=Synechococcus sp. PCC 7502 TaxID=1173263 RepID=UPI00029FB34E|nr:TOBE-like domain-containing protein [Synechococcus sp. PCC 7502]AFY73418.1 sulfate ABC transporter, ATP-binding protein [Synechococcus sp. PCC 7502]